MAVTMSAHFDADAVVADSIKELLKGKSVTSFGNNADYIPGEVLNENSPPVAIAEIGELLA